MTATYTFDRGFTLRRMFDAPPEMVFRAWTEPAHLDWFFNPGMPVTTPTVVDLRVGGVWRQQMVETPEKQYFTGGIYKEIVPAQKLVFTWGATDGWPPLDPDNLDEGPVVTLRFKPVGHGTEMDLKVQFPDHLSEQRVREWLQTGMREGWGVTIDRLVAQLGESAKAGVD